jgi:hypothetical protein
MDVDDDKEDLFNDVYDNEHIPPILKVPGVISAERYRSAPLTMAIGGKKKTIVADGEPQRSVRTGKCGCPDKRRVGPGR